MNTPVLCTERLLLRPFAAGDARAVFEGWEQDAEVAKYMFWQSHHDFSKTECWLREELQKITADDWYRWAVCDRASEELLGTGLLYYEPEISGWEIGYNLKRSEWGQGYTTEAMREILRFAWQELSITEVKGRYAAVNAASGHVMEKLGFIPVCAIAYPCNAGTLPGMLMRCTPQK